MRHDANLWTTSMAFFRLLGKNKPKQDDGFKNRLNAVERSFVVIEFDLDGTARSANENFLSTMGYRLEEIVGQHHQTFVDPIEVASPAYASMWQGLCSGRSTASQFERLGKDGKGFAVVAQEVRQFAQRSAQAASDIKALIQDSNGQVKNGVDLVNRAGEALNEIVGSIGKVAGIVQQISSASQEQASGVQEINQSITSMDEMTQQNSALVEQSTASARVLSDQESRLSGLIDFFKFDAASETPRQAPSRKLVKEVTVRAAGPCCGYG